MVVMANIRKWATTIGFGVVAFICWIVASATPGDQVGVMAVAGIFGGLALLRLFVWDRLLASWDFIRRK